MIAGVVGSQNIPTAEEDMLLTEAGEPLTTESGELIILE